MSWNWSVQESGSQESRVKFDFFRLLEAFFGAFEALSSQILLRSMRPDNSESYRTGRAGLRAGVEATASLETVGRDEKGMENL